LAAVNGFQQLIAATANRRLLSTATNSNCKQVLPINSCQLLLATDNSYNQPQISINSCQQLLQVGDTCRQLSTAVNGFQ
jgi:hypothetical protein